MDRNSNLYGTAQGCGSYGYGTVWKVSKKGTLTVLRTFSNKSSDGSFPVAGVIMGTKGNLYGDTTAGGAASGMGTVYELNARGTLTLLHSFAGSDGESPLDTLIRDAKGDFYGTAPEGGSVGYGTVWKLTP